MHLLLLTYLHEGPLPAHDMAWLRAQPEVTLVNETLPNNVLVVQTHDDLTLQRLKRLIGWRIDQSQNVALDNPVHPRRNVRIPRLRLVKDGGGPSDPVA